MDAPHKGREMLKFSRFLFLWARLYNMRVRESVGLPMILSAIVLMRNRNDVLCNQIIG